MGSKEFDGTNQNGRSDFTPQQDGQGKQFGQQGEGGFDQQR